MLCEHAALACAKEVQILIDLLVNYFDPAPAGVPVCAT